MSDNESDYYSEAPDSDQEEHDVMPVKFAPKKPIIVNAIKKFGNYLEDEDNDDIEEDDIDDAVVENNEDDYNEDDDVDVEQEGGALKDNDDDEHIDDDAIEENVEHDDDDDDLEINDDGDIVEKDKQPNKTVKKTNQINIIDDMDNDDYDEDDEYDENYLQKFNSSLNNNYIAEFHPECMNHNNDEVAKLSKVVRDENNIIIDSLHKTLPYLTKYEKARVLGQRAKQIEMGSKPLVKVPENIIDGHTIAELELREKKIPFIIKRPIPNGAFEYWNLKDLEIINF